MANKVVIEVEAVLRDEVTGKSKYVISGLDGIEDAAKDAQKELDKLGKKKVHPIIDADNNKLLKKLRESDNKVAKLAGKTFTTTLKLIDKGSDIVNKMEGGLKKIAGKTWSTVVKIKDYATAPLRKLKDMLFSIKSLVLAITAGLAAQKFVMQPINLADQYSGAKIGFQTLLGDSEGQQMMDKLDEFAKATPFKTSGVISSTQKMLAMGWNAEDIIDDLRTIGDAAAATGKGTEGLDAITRALSQIRSKGKLSSEELNQLAEAGISAKRYLSEGLGYGSGDAGLMKLSEDLEKGAIGAEKAITLILEGMKEYKGMMDKTANETVEGLWSQIEDTFEINIFRRWGQGLQDGAKRGFGSIIALIDKADGSLEKFGDTIYELGSSVSNWLADKFEKAVGRVLEITDTFEFKNASLGEKIGMLWKGVVSDPLKEWWENGGQEKTAATAGKIGGWMGSMLTKGLLAIFGATDVLQDIDGTDMGGNIAGSFVQGFLQNFDGSAITDAFVDAISNVWNALPGWAKILLGVHVGNKALTGLSSLIGNVTSVVGAAGGYAAGGKGIAGVLSALGYGAAGKVAGSTGALAMAGLSGGTAAMAGLGLVTAAGGALYAGRQFGNAYKSYQAGDETGYKASMARAGGTTIGIGAGAVAGAKIGGAVGTLAGPVGTAVGGLIGAGLGTVVGWFAGDRIAKNIESAKYESEELKSVLKDSKATSDEINEAWEKAKWENAKKHFGDIKLSLGEIERLTSQIVWGDDIGNYEKFKSATQQAAASLESLKNAAADTDKWMWKAGLGVKFSADELESIQLSFDEYLSSAQAYLENKHYEFTASVSMLVDVESEGGKGILDSGNAFYKKMEENLSAAGKELGDALTKALEDGIISADEQAAITAAQQKIAAITAKISNAEMKAELELIKIKFGSGKLDIDSFESFMSQMETTLNERVSANDEAFTASVSSLQLQLEEGAIKQDEFDKQLQLLVDGYTGKVDSIKAEIMQVELDMIGDAYATELGNDAAQDLQKALQHAIDNNLDPIEIDDKKMAELLNIKLDGNGETIANIQEMLSGVFNQLELVEVDGKVLLNLGIENEGNIAEQVENKVSELTPDRLDEHITINLTAEERIQNNIDILAEEFGIDKIQAETILWQLYGTKGVQNKVSVMCEEFGIDRIKSQNILWQLSGQKSILNHLSLGAGDFGIQSSYSYSPIINLQARLGTVTPVSVPKSSLYGPRKARGGIIGGDSAMEAFARGGRTDGGIVGGSTRFIRVNEESPEMIIPLSNQRRERAMKLWAKTGELLDVPGFARGGRTSGVQDEGIRFHRYGAEEHTGGQMVQVDVGGITFEIHVNGTDAQSIAQAIRDQIEDISEDVAGILADSFAAQFENTPARGGAA